MNMFLAYAKHQTELDEIVRQIREASKYSLEGTISLRGMDYLSQEDLEYIQRQLNK